MPPAVYEKSRIISDESKGYCLSPKPDLHHLRVLAGPTSQPLMTPHRSLTESQIPARPYYIVSTRRYSLVTPPCPDGTDTSAQRGSARDWRPLSTHLLMPDLAEKIGKTSDELTDHRTSQDNGVGESEQLCLDPSAPHVRLS